MKTKRGVWRTILSVLFFVLICKTTVYAQGNLPEPKYGWIKVETNLDSAYVVIDDRFYDPHLITSGGENDSIRTKEGPRKVTIVWKGIHDFTKRTYVYPHETRVIEHGIVTYPENPKTSFHTIQRQYNLEISTAEDADIYLNRKFMGKGRVRVLHIHDTANLEIWHPEKGVILYEKAVATQNMTQINRYYKNTNKRKWHYYTLPFLKQGYHGEYEKMLFSSLSYIAFGSLTYTYGQKVVNRRADFNSFKRAYVNAPTSWRAEQIKETLKLSHRELKDAITMQNVMIGGLVATYVIGVVDAFFFRPREGYSGPSKFDSQKGDSESNYFPRVSLKSNSESIGNGLMIGLTWNLK